MKPLLGLRTLRHTESKLFSKHKAIAWPPRTPARTRTARLIPGRSVSAPRATRAKTCLYELHGHKSLLDLACAKVASMIKGKAPVEIRKTFNTANDATPEEEAKVREENK